ncbi:MAG: GNAT family N-acetyltransferase [bacterium]
MKMREYVNTDLDEIMQLFYECVHTVNAPDYTQEQLDAMAPLQPNRVHWEQSLERNYTLIVVDDDQRIIGFGNVGQTGYIDRLYVEKNHLRQGIASMICDALEAYASKVGNRFLNTSSTITSRSFFEKRGYKMIDEQLTLRHGIDILFYLMEKRIGA